MEFVHMSKINLDALIADLDSEHETNKQDIKDAVNSTWYEKAGKLFNINVGILESLKAFRFKRARQNHLDEEVMSLDEAKDKIASLIEKHTIDRDNAVKYFQYDEAAKHEMIIEGIKRAQQMLSFNDYTITEEA